MSNAYIISISQLPNAKGLPLPEYKTSHSAGMDLLAAIDKDVLIKTRERKLIPTGIVIEIPDGYEGQIRPRSGLALSHGITVLNSPGTIDSDYRGELGCILFNAGNSDFVVERGMRIAQLVISPYIVANLNIVTNLGETSRGSGGFGSTGI